jgi:DNA-binding beta-propeller fold protein YncE
MVSPVKNDYRAFVTAQLSDEEAVRILNPDSSFPEKHSVANTLAVIDTKTFEVVETYAVGVEPLGMAVTPDGKKVYVANAGTGAETLNSYQVIQSQLSIRIQRKSRPLRLAPHRHLW